MSYFDDFDLRRKPRYWGIGGGDLYEGLMEGIKNGEYRIQPLEIRYDSDGPIIAELSLCPNGGIGKKEEKEMREPGCVTIDESLAMDRIVNEVIDGKWGSGEDRVKRLTKAGYNADAIQALVNIKLNKNKNKKFFDSDLIPKKIIINGPATVFFWRDGIKTVVKCAEDDTFDLYHAYCVAVTKRIMGTNSRIKSILKHAEIEDRAAKEAKEFFDAMLKEFIKKET